MPLNKTSGGATDIKANMFAVRRPDQVPVAQPNPPTPAPLVPDLAAIYGEQVARELPLIESVLRRVAVAGGVELGEGDLDSFCRSRQAKLNLHAQQRPDEHFEQVRLLNMLYEGCLGFLKDAAKAQANGDAILAGDKAERASKIISHFIATLDHSKGGNISPELLRLYDFSLRHLHEARSEASGSKILAVHAIIEKIYLGYLDVELQQDAEKMLKAKVARLHNNSVDRTAADGGASR